MSRKYKIILALLVVLILLLTYLEANQARELNWSPSYSASDKIPLGSQVLFKNLQDQELQIEKVKLPPYEFLDDSTRQGTYFFLNDRLNIDDNELKKLFSWVEKGNTLFLIAEDFSQNILDTLNIKVKVVSPENGTSSKPLLNFTNEQLKRETPFLFDRETYNLVFKDYDSLQPELLGVSQLYEDSLKIKNPEINFLRDSIGKGLIYLHSTPKAFSNYFLLDGENYEYAERALAFIPVEKELFWDQYYKSGKTFTTSPLFVILNNRTLKWAYYFIIIGSILFVIFEGKRKQRSIPVIPPLKNQTLHFTRTIAGLYLERNDYKRIATKKIALFLDYVRSHWRVPTNELNEEFYSRLAALTETPVKEIREFWLFMKKLEDKENVSKDELLKLNKAIDAFKRRQNGK